MNLVSLPIVYYSQEIQPYSFRVWWLTCWLPFNWWGRQRFSTFQLEFHPMHYLTVLYKQPPSWKVVLTLIASFKSLVSDINFGQACCGLCLWIFLVGRSMMNFLIILIKIVNLFIILHCAIGLESSSLHSNLSFVAHLMKEHISNNIYILLIQLDVYLQYTDLWQG